MFKVGIWGRLLGLPMVKRTYLMLPIESVSSFRRDNVKYKQLKRQNADYNFDHENSTLCGIFRIFRFSSKLGPMESTTPKLDVPSRFIWQHQKTGGCWLTELYCQLLDWLQHYRISVTPVPYHLGSTDVTISIRQSLFSSNLNFEIFRGDNTVSKRP